MPVSPLDQSLMDYFRVQDANMRNYNEDTDMSDLGPTLYRLCNTINSTSVQDLERRVARKDYDAMINLGLRCFTGCTVPQNVKRSERLWMAVLDLSISHPALPTQLGAACSFLANLYWEEFRETDGLQSRLNKAVFHARGTVEHGMRTPTVLVIIRAVAGYGLRDKAPYNNAEMQPLWAVHEERLREMEIEERKRNRKVRRQPNAYVCAKCDIGASSRMALRKCAGPCKTDDKPSYCSKECQVADWPSHKPDCKPGKKGGAKAGLQSTQTVAAGTPRWEMFKTSLDPSAPAPSKNQEYRTVVPGPNGRPVEIVSNTMTPAAMRKFRDQVNEAVIEELQAPGAENSDVE